MRGQIARCLCAVSEKSGDARGKQAKGNGLVLALAAVLAMSTTASAALIAVGSGEHSADMVIEFGDGAIYTFEVAFDQTTTGLGLFDIVEAETSLTTVRQDFGFGIFVDGISYEGHSDIGYDGGENWWHYWVRDSAQADWVSSAVGVAERVVEDGCWDGWVYGRAGEPVPEPATGLLVAFAGLIGLWGRKCVERR